MAMLYAAFEFKQGDRLSIANIVVEILNQLILSGKFFAIFAFLFGLSYFIQMDRASKKGINYQWRFLWRIIILLVIGYLHSLLYSGDILLVYAIFGIPLVFMYKVKDKVLIAIIIILLAGIPRYIAWGVNQFETKTIEKAENKPDVWEKQVKTYRTGSFLDVVKVNAVDGIISKAEYQLSIEGRAYQTLAMFLLGLIVGRRRYFERIEENMALTRKIFKRSIWATVVFFVFSGGLFALFQFTGMTLILQFAMTFYNFYNLSMALLITTAFIILYQRIKPQKLFKKLVPYGKMGMTNYMMQSVISIPLLYGFGLGLAAHINLLVGLGLGIVIYTFQVLYSQWWLSRYIYGPFEWLWRSFTWFKWQPFIREKDEIKEEVKLSEAS
jgi:uncharacterized protein